MNRCYWWGRGSAAPAKPSHKADRFSDFAESRLTVTHNLSPLKVPFPSCSLTHYFGKVFRDRDILIPEQRVYSVSHLT